MQKFVELVVDGAVSPADGVLTVTGEMGGPALGGTSGGRLLNPGGEARSRLGLTLRM